MNTYSSTVFVGGPERAAQVRQALAGIATLAGEIREAGGLGLLPTLNPDIVVLDCAAPGLNPALVLHWIASLPTPPLVLALGSGIGTQERSMVLELGAAAYLAAGSSDDIQQALRKLTAGSSRVPTAASAPAWLVRQAAFSR